MDIHIYNSLERKQEEFRPIKGRTAGLYTCGPTVYNYAHIGNLRTYVFEDVLKRTLEYNGFKVKHIMNITDVGHLTSDADEGEDKMEKGARREGKSAWDIAKFYEKAFLNDLKELNCEPATKYPHATEYIKEQINLIKKLEKKGFTYTTSDGVYFDTSKLPDYGKLANLQNQKLKAGARIELGEKKNATDFALWKFSGNEKRQMEWKSPWGVGFPGWHVECSAMAEKLLGVPFDIHCGGIDHIPVHHTNEIAQTEAATGKMLANYWMHGEFLMMGSDKMAKSGDNFVTLQTLKERGISPLAYRYFLLQTHYRKQLTFSWEALQAAQNGLLNLYAHIGLKWNELDADSSLDAEFLKHINNDLDTPSALAMIQKSLKAKKISKEQLKTFDKVLGLNIIENAENIIEEEDEVLPDEAQNLINARNAARAAKDWAKSDELRRQLEDMGYEVKDTPKGTQVARKYKI